MNLSELKEGQKGIIVKVKGRGAFRKRITEMGFIKGQQVEVIKNAPLRDPIEYRIMNYSVSLRRSEASLIQVVTDAEEVPTAGLEQATTVVADSDRLQKKIKEKGRVIDVVLVGNPNSGKTTIFNYASRSHEKVGNYSGVTIEAKSARFKQGGYTFHIIDLPGTYSLSAYSPEELYVRQHILEEHPDVVINVVDASNLERNLYLTTQLIEMDVKVVVALNMYDELLDRGDKFNYQMLGEMLGIPFVPTVGSKGKGIRELFDKVIEVYEDKDPIVRHIHINFCKPVEEAIKTIQDEIWKNQSFTDQVSSRFYAIKLLEKDPAVSQIIEQLPNAEQIKALVTREIQRLEKDLREDCETLITDARYGFISGALKETYIENKQKRKLKTETEIIDTFLTHKLFGFPVFFFFMWLMFYSTFTLGEYPKQWIEAGVGIISGILRTFFPDGMFKDLLVEGVVAGVGSVIVFLPNILILFFFISLMEDTGYMARVAFIMDRIMHRIGLHGRSFIPLLMGFGCNVPAIMATRTIPSRSDRLLTILINPFMTCSARLPVYILIIAAFFPDNPTIILLSIYLTGIILAAALAILFKKTLFKRAEAPFVMELPPYRLPTLRSVLKNMWYKAAQYLKKMGGIILLAMILIWAAGYFPLHRDKMAEYDRNIAQINAEIAQLQANTDHSDQGEPQTSLLEQKQQQVKQLQLEKQVYRLENSFIGQLGRMIEPLITPLGFDWKMGVSLVTGAAAKEIVIGTLSILYFSDDPDNHQPLVEKLRSQVYTSGPRAGQPIFTPVVAMAFMLFVLIYFPCVAVVAAVRKETGSWRWAAFLAIYTTALAYLVALIVYQVGNLIF